MSGQVAVAEVEVDASPQQVWQALTDPDLIAKYMFGSQVETDWHPGSPIFWRGEYEGRPYEDKGEVIQAVPNQRLEVTHFSPLTGQEDVPENYHRVAYELSDADGRTRIRVTQDGNASDDEAKRATETWQSMLDGLKGVVEGG